MKINNGTQIKNRVFSYQRKYRNKTEILAPNQIYYKNYTSAQWFTKCQSYDFMNENQNIYRFYLY